VPLRGQLVWGFFRSRDGGIRG